jgi:predicted S18 family serine protease
MKQIMKIRLRQDGTWENIYDDNSSDDRLNQAKKLSEIASDYLDQAVEASGYRDAKEILAYIKNKT